MDPRAGKADEDAEFRGRPLWGGGAAVAAEVVVGLFLEGRELDENWGVSDR